MAGLALTGAAVPAAWYAHRELTRVEEPITPGEATAGPADVATQRLADKLRGVWTLRFEGRDAGLRDAPLQGLELFLDIAPRGRGIRGYIDTADNLRGEAMPRFRVIGDLKSANAAKLYLRVMDGHAGDDPHSDTPDYEFSLILDEVWGGFGNAGSGTLSGRIERLD